MTTLTASQSYAGRVASARARMDALGLQALVASRPRSMYWLSGFNVVIYSRPQFVLLTRDEVVLIVPRVREARARAVSHAGRVIGYSDGSPVPSERDPFHLLHALLAEATAPGARIGFEGDAMPVAVHARVAAGLEGGRMLADASGLIRDLRMVKDAWELSNIRKATVLAQLGMESAHRTVMDGGSEIDANVSAEARMMQEWAARFPGDDVTGYGDEEDGVISALWCWTRAGRHIALSLPASTHDPIAPETPVLSIIWATINGYGAEFERTFSKAPMTGEAARAFDAMMACREAVIPLMRPGAVCADLCTAAADAMARGGFDIGPGFLGHGLGLGHHERPQLVPATDTPLAPGMALAFEPAIFKPDYGVTQSDIVLITEEGHEVLTDWTALIPA